MWAIRPRAWAWGVARAGDTLLLAISASADADADVVISDLHVCACSIAVRGRFGRRGRVLRCVLLRALLFCTAWRCVALPTTSRPRRAKRVRWYAVRIEALAKLLVRWQDFLGGYRCRFGTCASDPETW
jgi:hypothetical protein